MGGKVDKNNAREGFRVPLHSVTGEYAFRGVVDRCEVVDISFSGIGLKVNNIVTENDVLDVRFRLEKDVRIYCKGKVVNVRGGRVGLNFIEIPPKAKKSIDKYIENYTNSNIGKLMDK